MTSLKPVITRLGACSKCSGRSDYNSPAIPAIDALSNDQARIDSAPLYCDNCARDLPLYTISIEQRLHDGHRHINNSYQTHRKGKVIFYGDFKQNRVDAAWFYGHRSIPKERVEALSEKGLTIEQMLDHFIEMEEKKIFFCTSCNLPLHESEVAGYPLFAGVNCASCWGKHLLNAEAERKRGAVCRLCGQPYSFCCC